MTCIIYPKMTRDLSSILGLHVKERHVQNARTCEQFILKSKEKKIITKHMIAWHILVGGGFLRMATCIWRCGFARPRFILGRSTRNSTLGRIDQLLPVCFWVYKIDKTQSLRIMIMVKINNMLSMIALIKWWDNALLLCILSDVQY